MNEEFYVPEDFDKQALAGKIKKGLKLNNRDRENLYYLLTGIPLYLSERGKQPEDMRDENLALDFIEHLENCKGQIKKFKNELYEKYMKGDFKDNTFIESSPGRYHVYWRVVGCNRAQFSALH